MVLSIFLERVGSLIAIAKVFVIMAHNRLSFYLFWTAHHNMTFVVNWRLNTNWTKPVLDSNWMGDL